MDRKNQFAQGLVVLMTALAQADDRADNALAVWFARGYAQRVVDADLTALGLSAADMLQMITIAEQLRAWVDDAGRGGALAKYRSDV